MTLLDEIIAAAVDEKVPIGTLLRKCLVLEQQVKNEKFRVWLNQELDGYHAPYDVPDYRVFKAISYGFFVGYAGAQINNQPLSLHPLAKEEREAIEYCKLVQPAASYDRKPAEKDQATIPWPPGLTVKYQQKFIKNFVLNRAWQAIPDSIIVGLVETVRTRILRFALELKSGSEQT